MQARLPSESASTVKGCCRRVVDDGPAGRHGRGDPFVGHVGGEPQVEMPALAGSLVVLGALEPQAWDSPGGVEDRVVYFAVRAAGEQN